MLATFTKNEDRSQSISSTHFSLFPPLQEGIKPSYDDDLALVEDLWKVGLGRLFNQEGDIYVDRNGRTVCTGKEIMWESREHRTLMNSVAWSFNQWARNTDKEKKLYCTTEASVDVTSTYRVGYLVEEMDDLTKKSHRSVDVAIYSGERQMIGRVENQVTIKRQKVETLEHKRQKVLETKVRNFSMSPQLLIQIGVTNPYTTEKDNMDTLSINCAGVQGLIGCQRPHVGYYIKFLHDGRMDSTYVDASDSDNSDNNEEVGTVHEKFTTLPLSAKPYGTYKAHGFLVIKVLSNSRMPSEDDAMNPTNSDLIKGKLFLVRENGQFGADAIINEPTQKIPLFFSLD